MARMTTAVNTEAPMVLRLAQGAGRRAWGPSVFPAIVVGALLLLPPTNAVVDGYADSSLQFRLPVGLVAGALVVAGVVVGRRWPVRGTLLALLPFLATAITGWFAYGWWLGLLAIAMLAAL